MNGISTIIIDCSALCYASAHTLRGLEADEVETGVIFGFLRQIRALSQLFHSTDIVFCWDSKSSKRKELFPEYKVKRGKKKKDDPELAAIFAATYRQMDKLKNHVIPSMGFLNSFEQDGFEADDLIADIVFGYPNCVMVTNDADMYQLLDYADMWKPMKKELVTANSFQDKYGIVASEWAMVKAVAGCSTDEVPGIPGVGEKTAIKYLNHILPEKYKAYANIEEGWQEVVMRNEPLVRLPFEGTEHITLVDHYSLNILGFWKMCNEFRFESFSKGVEKTKWELFFRGEL